MRDEALPADPARRGDLLRRLHSISGVGPLGLFLVGHLFINARALGGQRPFVETAIVLGRVPLLPVLEIALIFVPLLFHSLYGIFLASRRRANALEYSYAHDWQYVLQRVSGAVAFIFIAWHLFEFRAKRAFSGLSPLSYYDVLAAHLSSTKWGIPWLAFFYIAGILATIFHFMNGLHAFLRSWGFVSGAATERPIRIALTTFGVLLALLGTDIVVHFATGSSLSPFPSH